MAVSWVLDGRHGAAVFHLFASRAEDVQRSAIISIRDMTANQNDPGNGTAQPTLPAELANAIVAPAGGRVVLVLGAGTSVEPPTSLPLAGQLAETTYAQLVADEVLLPDSCENPADLSTLADLVYSETHSQQALIDRLSIERFKRAQPNSGHLVAAALLRERALGSVLTLNFDTAITAALTELGAKEDVAEVRGPEEHDRLGNVSLIYLHRTAHHPANEWILRTETLATAWSNAWEEAIAARVLTTPIVVFAGLGSPAAVLTETVRRLREMVGNQVLVLQVDPQNREDSAFSAALEVTADRYIQLGWSAFMDLVAARVVLEQVGALQNACDSLTADHDWPDEDISGIGDQIANAGLIGFGTLRCRWLLEDGRYTPWVDCDPIHVADLVLALALIERNTGFTASVGADGVVELWEGDRLRGAVGVVSARGRWRWGAIEPKIETARRHWQNRYRGVRKVLVAAVPGRSPGDLSPPESIVAGGEAHDIARGPAMLEYLSVDELRDHPDTLRI